MWITNRWIAKKRITGGVGFLPHSVLKRDGEPDGECEDPLGMRNAIIAELIATEKELGNDLNYVVEKYINPSVLDPNAPDCVKENRDLIFGNFKKIAEFHNSVFYEGIKFYTTEPKMIGKAICRLERDFDMHVEYCQNEPAAQEFLEDDDEASEYFADLSNKLGDSKTLSEHLKLPIQRINDYQLLLKELVKYQQILKEPTKDCERALDFMYGVPTKANDLKFINSIEGYKGSIQKLGRLLAHEWFTITDAKNCTKERYCFLFKSRILVCKVKRISDDRSIFILKDIHKLPDCEIVDNEEDPLTFQLVHKNPFTHTRYPITFKAHGPQSKQAWVECIQEFKEDSVALQEHFVDDLKVDGLADGETAEEETSTQKLYKKILAEQEKEKKKAEARKAFDEATKPKPKPRAKSKTPQPEEVAAAATGAEGEAAAPVVYINPDGTPAEPGTPGAVPAPSNLGADQLPTDFRVPTPDEQANMSETVTVTYPQPASEVPVAGVGAGGDEKPDLSLNVNLAINESRPSTPSSAPQTPLREPNRPRFTKTIDPWACEPGQSTAFECTLFPSTFPATVTWLKDNKPLDDQLADRVTIVAEENNTRFRLSMLHCRVEDTGTYTARASNQDCSATCSAYLLVQEMTPEEKEKRAAELGAQIMVRFKDTEVLEETYLRFLVQVKGDPAPVIKFFKDDLLITPDNNRVKIVDEKAANGYYELVVPYVGPGDAGRYTCSVMNKFGEDKCDAVVKVVPEKDVFKGLADGPPGEKADFKWLRDGKPFDPEERFKVQFRDDEDSLALIFQHVKPEDAGLYTCVASTSSGKISCSAELTVEGSITQLHREPEKPCITTENMVAHANVGSSAMLELKVAGFPKPQITWTHEGKPIEHGGRFRFLHEDDETLALVIKHVEADDSGMYKLVAKNELGESTMDIELSVKAPPKFRFKMEDRKALSEETLVMEVDIEASPVPVVKWFKDGKELFVNERISFEKDGSKYKMTILKANMDDSGTYSVCATNEVSQATEYWNLAVSQPPKFIKGLVKSMECKEQENVSLDVKIQCKPAPQVKWYICKPSATSQTKEYKVDEEKQELVADGRHVIMSMDGENYSLKLTGLTRVDSGFYRCIATNDFGQSTQDCEINVKCAPQLSQKLADTKLTEGDSNVILSVAVNSYPEPKVTWYINDSEITESRTAFVQSSTYGVYNLTLKDVSTDMTGKYTCKIANELGTTETSASYSVHSKPKFTKPLEEKNDVDEAQTLNLSVTVQANPAPQVKWYKNGNEVSADARIKITKEGTETYNLTVTLLKLEDTGDYEVKATNEQGTSSSVTKVTVSTFPTILSHTMNDTKVYESLSHSFEVHADGLPRPEAKWFKDGKAIKSDDRIVITSEEKVYKLEITEIVMEDAGLYKCTVSNRLGDKSQETNFGTISVNEFRKPTVNADLKPVVINKNENGTLTLMLVADPVPDIVWYHNGKEIATDDLDYEMTLETKDIENNLKECYYSLTVNKALHGHTGEYKIFAKNKYGEMETATRLDVQLLPEISELKDFTINPYENTQFEVVINSNPKPKVTWYQNEEVISNTDHTQLIADIDAEIYRLAVSNITLVDAGTYKVVASNSLGEASRECKLTVHNEAPQFVKPIEQQTVKAYGDVDFRVRYTAVPTASIKWYFEGKELVSEGRYKIEVNDEHGTASLQIEKLEESDIGVYSVTASNLAGQAECSAQLQMAQTPPSFINYMDKYHEIDEGETLTIKMKVDGSPIPTVKWYKDGDEIKDDNRVKLVSHPDGSIELLIAKVVPGDCGAYKIVAANKNGERAVLSAVAVNPSNRKPVFIKPLADIVGKADDILKLEAQIMAFPAPEVHWFKDGYPVRPHHNINFINSPGGIIGIHFDKVTLHDAGKYSCTISNRLGELEATAVVEVEAAARKPVFQDALQPTSVVEGYPAKLEVKLYGHPKPVLTWTHRGEDIVVDGKRYKEVTDASGITSLIIDKVMPEDAGEYAVTANNDLGFATCKNRLEVTLKEKDNMPEEVPAFIHPLRDAHCEEGGHLTLDVPFLGNPIPEVVWSKNGQPIAPGDKTTITCDGRRVGLDIRPMTLADVGKYDCTLTNRLGKASTNCNVAVRKVFQAPTFTQTFGDLQQLPNYDAKFLCRINGLPAPDVVWTKEGKVLPGRDTDKYQVKRDGDACLLYIRNCTPEDNGKFSCTAKNSAGENTCTAGLEIVEKIGKRQKAEAPIFLKKLGDCVVYQGMTARFTACVTGCPEPELEWYRDTTRLFNSERVKFEKETSGLVRLIIEKVGEADMAIYRLRATNEHGQADCEAKLVYDTLEERADKKTMSDQYSEYDKIRKSGAPLPLADRPIVSRMTDRNLTLSWKPSIPKGPREPVNYRVEMCELPGGDWFDIRSGIKSCACDIRNLEPYRDYKFRVRVENRYGISDPSPYAITYREKLEPDPPKFIPYLEPNLDFRPETSPFFPKDFDIEKPHIDGFAKAPKFLRQEDYNNQYGVMDHNCQLEWFVYGYPKPKVTYTFNDQPVEMGGRFDCSYTRNGQACLFINKMMSRDCGIYEACAINEHGEARQRVNLAVAEYPRFIKRPEETLILARKSAKIEVRISGTPFPEVKWYKDWLPIAESSRIKLQFIEPDTAVLQIGEAMAKDEGLYSICARNIAGSISTSFSIHVEESEAAYFYSTYTGRIIKEMKPHKNKYIEEFYDLGEELGRGTAGVTYHAVERLSGRNYAAKTMHGKQDLKPFMMNELEIYNQLNHRKLLRLHDVFETKRTLTLVTELASGGELLESLTKQEYVTESEIAGYIRQVLLGLEYMHNQNIAHLGLTPGDILISHPGGDDLKICDFGLSRKIYFTKLASLNYGMPEFVAPEVANGGGVHMATDMWSVGVITYLLLTGVSLFRGKHDRDTLLKVREGKWDDLHLISRNCSDECRDFIKSLLMYQMDNRMDVHTALKHPWLLRADKLPQDEPHLSTDALRHYYQGLRDWYSNASCRTWYRRKPLDGADTHPSCMVYPPGVTYTPPASPKATPERALWENKIESRGGVDYELGLIKNESHYQYGPDTYLLQLRDVDFPCRLREYMKVAANRSAAFALNDQRDWRAPVIRERRRFTDVMDEEIDDERKDRIAKYGSADTYTLRRLRHELGTRMEGQFEAEAMVESKRDGQPPFMREKPQMLPILEDKPAKLSCLAVGDPKPVVQWFKNDNLVPEGKRVTITEDSQGRSILSFDPALPNDAGIYKVVARNRVGQTVARVRVVLAGPPSAPDSPEVAEKSDTEIFLKWKQPKDDGNSIVLCYSLQYKEADKVEWVDCASGNIDHEFFLVRNLCPKLEYQFRLAARNHIGWSDKGVPSAIVKTRDVGCPKVTSISKAMLHLQQLTESGQKVQGLEEVEEEIAPIMDYSVERSPLTWRDENPSEKFNFISEISRGRFSVVAKAIERATDKVIVAKVLGWTPESELDVLREFEAWHSLRHERICLLNEAYRVGSAATLILEKLQGSDVLTYLASRHEYSEQMVVSITQQVLDGLQYLHWRGICHLAIEPDNVVMAGIRSAQVKLVDFGSAQRVSKLGTGVPRSFATEFSAPEILNNEPAFPQSDVWSVGVLTYVLLSGVSPYRAESVEETKANITYVRYRFEHLYKELTGEATRFLMFLFKRTPCKRPTAEECMEHRWLLPTDHLVKKRERAVFLGNRLKEFSEVYHGEKTRAAAAMEEKKPKAIPMEVKLARSVSVQEELQTPN